MVHVYSIHVIVTCSLYAHCVVYLVMVSVCVVGASDQLLGVDN